MWPELLKQLRSGLVFNPLDELQKRATQYGESVGEGLQAQRAQGGYAKAHPKSQRAQNEMMTNAMMMALQFGTGGPKTPKTWKPIEGVAAEHLARINLAAPEALIAPAMANKKSGLYNTGIMHAEAVPGLLRYLAKTGGQMEANVSGWLTTHGRIVSKTEAYKIKKAELSPAVKAQIATRAQQSGKEPSLTSEDMRGKLYANKGTKADAPMTGADMERIVTRNKTAKNMFDALHADKGFTFDPVTGEKITSGFAVGGGKKNGILLKTPLTDLTEGQLRDFLDTHAGNLPKGAKWGGWVDEHGMVHVEPADIHSNVESAHQIGNKRGEKAIYDLSKGEEIPVRKLPPAADSVMGRVIGAIKKGGFIEMPGDQAIWDAYQKSLTDPNYKPTRADISEVFNPKDVLKDVVARGKPVDWNKIAPPRPERIGTEATPLYGKLNPKSPTAGFIIPFSEKTGKKLGVENKQALQKMPPELIEAANIIHKDNPLNPARLKLHKDNPGPLGTPDPNEPTMMFKTVLDSLANPASMRGKPRVPDIRDKHIEEFRKIDSTWNVAYKAIQALSKQIHDEPATRRNALADALRGGPKPPQGEPSLLGQYEHPNYISTVDAMKYAKQLPHQFKAAIADAQRAGNLFYGASTKDYLAPHRTERSKAIDIEMAARRVIAQAQAGVFVPPHATPAEAAAIIGHGEQVARGLHKFEPSIWDALQRAMKAARFIP